MVDMDLERFFDRVNHDILMSRIARKIKDKRVYGEGRNRMFVKGENIPLLPGFVPTACYQRAPGEQGRSGWIPQSTDSIGQAYKARKM